MKEEFVRTAALFGEKAIQQLGSSKVALFGVGGVGSYAAEALARAGIGHLVLVDADCVAPSNINRQLVALQSTLGRPKVEVMKERIKDINPDAKVEARKEFFGVENPGSFLCDCNYIIDAIDTVTSKIHLVELALQMQIPIISAMGCGNKVDATRFRVDDLSRTSVCPLCKVMRKELKKRGIHHLKVVYSDEQPVSPQVALTGEAPRRPVPASAPFVPGVAGLILAGEVIRSLCHSKTPLI